MISTNLQIIKELQEFLKEACKMSEVYCSKPSDFSRAKKLTMERVVLMIMSLMKNSLAVEIDNFFEQLSQGVETCTKSAFSQARKKLKPLIFKSLNTHLCNSFYSNGRIKKWKGKYRLEGVDGTFLCLINTEDIKAYFGEHKNQHQHSGICLAKAVVRYDLLNEIALQGTIGKESKSETFYARQLLEGVTKDVISVYDRNYPSYEFIYDHVARGLHFVIRCKINQNAKVKDFVKSGKLLEIVEFSPTKTALKSLKERGIKIEKNNKIKVRLVRVDTGKGQPEILVTSLLEKDFKVSDFAYIYFKRWGSETFFDRLKNQFQVEIFSGHTTLSVIQEYYASIFVHNLQSILIEECEEQVQAICKKRERNYKINRNVSLGILKNKIALIFLSTESQKIVEVLKTKFIKHLERIRPGRANERIRKYNPKRGKYRTLSNYRKAI